MRIVGHRGARGYEPENTLRSVRAALEMGVDAVEVDVQLSRDGEPVVIHDATLGRTANGLGRVDEYTYQQLRALDAGKGERIPHIEEVIALTAGRVPLHIELKAPDSWERIAERLRDKDPDDFVVSSFSAKEIYRFHRALPRVKTAFLYETRLPALAITILTGASAIQPSLDFVTERGVCRAHGADVQVNVFTVNKERDFARVRELHVDGIFTDYPDRAIRYFR